MVLAHDELISWRTSHTTSPRSPSPTSPSPLERLGPVHEARLRPLHQHRRAGADGALAPHCGHRSEKLESPGPVFFHQVLLGRCTEPFTSTKFRSMTPGTNPYLPSMARCRRLTGGRPRPAPARSAAQVGRAPASRVHRRRPADGRHGRNPPIHQRVQGRHVRRRAGAVHPEPVPRRGPGHPRFKVRPGHHRTAGRSSGRNDRTATTSCSSTSRRRCAVAVVGLEIRSETPKMMARGIGALTDDGRRCRTLPNWPFAADGRCH